MNILNSQQHSVNRAERGFSLLEVAVAIGVLVMVLAGFSAMVMSGMQMERSTNAHGAAVIAVQSKIEEVRGQIWNQMLTSGVNYTFAVEGLKRIDGSDAGEVTFLTEDAAATLLGQAALDFDLDGTDNETEAPHGGFKMFPVQVTVTWRDGATGNAQERSTSVATIVNKMPGQDQ